MSATDVHALILQRAKEALRIARILCRDADTALWSEKDYYILTHLRDALHDLDELAP